ncbi:sigma-70 family RNA polymerase sigma factor [Microbacterium sp. 3J1]|uniref:sigma-70 family RNA polymerase sigma factor n=1 Tax=Microbacterium sp. 3J1 TaxID=861269 RepID=UPI000AB2F57A|nr:sigma-70 family RNA polymerase sigma factor [Microbacterium sp. 3J1]
MTTVTRTTRRSRFDADVGDDELVAATRAGDARAYGVLWDRHSPAALRAARAITSSIDPEDLVSEAFAKTLSAIRNGGGPTDAFRPYLFAAVRSAAATWGSKQKDIALEYIDELPVDDVDDSLDVLSDKALLASAFKELPERWRTLLWYLEVEGMKPREIAPLMGLSPNAVSVLASRAREGFKTAWLQAHIKEPGRDAECRWTCERIVAQGRRRHVARTDRSRFDAHLESCRRCTMASEEVSEASSKLRAVLLPLLLGGPAAAAYSASSATPASAAVATGVAGTAGSAESSSKTLAPWLVASGAIVAVAIAAAAVAVVGQLAPAEDPGAVDVGSRESVVVPTPAPIAPPATEEAVPPSGVVPPAPVPETPPEVVPVEEPAPPRDAVTPTDESSEAVAPPAAPQVSPPGEPTPPPLTSPARPLTFSWLLAEPVTVPTSITGTGTPGGEVSVLDEAGRTIATAVVGADGLFSVLPDPDALHQGMSVSVRQVAPTGEVTESAAVGPIVFETPALSAATSGRFRERTDADGDGEADDIELGIEGIAGASVDVSLDRAGSTRIVLDGGAVTAQILDVQPGRQRIDLRYVDPESGALGLVVTAEVIVRP